MKSDIFIAKAIKGELNLGSEINASRLKDSLKHHEGETYRIERMKKTRSLSQNALYHLYLSVIERETGNNANDLHEYFKRTLLPPRLIKVMGKELKIPATTTTLTKSDFGEYMTRIEAETNVPIPNPKEAGYYSDYN